MFEGKLPLNAVTVLYDLKEYKYRKRLRYTRTILLAEWLKYTYLLLSISCAGGTAALARLTT